MIMRLTNGDNDKPATITERDVDAALKAQAKQDRYDARCLMNDEQREEMLDLVFRARNLRDQRRRLHEAKPDELRPIVKVGQGSYERHPQPTWWPLLIAAAACGAVAAIFAFGVN